MTVKINLDSADLKQLLASVYKVKEENIHLFTEQVTQGYGVNAVKLHRPCAAITICTTLFDSRKENV